MKTRLSMTCVVAAALVLMLAQTASLMHGQKYGDEPHSHQGVQCMFVSGLAGDDLITAGVMFSALAVAFIFAQGLKPQRQMAPASARSSHFPRAPPVL